MAKTPLLRNLILIQMLAIVAAVGSLGLAFWVTTQSIYFKELANIRQKAEDAISERQEKWRTWQELGLTDALREEITLFGRLFPIEKLAVLKQGELPNPLSSEEIVLPHEIATGPYVVYIRLDAHQIRSGQIPFLSGFIGLGVAGFSFLVIILFSAWYLHKNIHSPIRELNESFVRFQSGQEFQVKHIKAKGEIRHFVDAAERMYGDVKEHEKKTALVAIARQLAHDIKSPVAALKVGLADLPQLPEDQRLLLRTAASRITDIANNLLERGKDRVSTATATKTDGLVSDEPLSIELLPSLVDMLVSEKRWEYRSRLGLTIEWVSELGAPQDLFVEVAPAEFKRVISNLINNAVEAVETKGGNGHVVIQLQREDEFVLLRIMDSGNGIEAKVIPKLMACGASFGKVAGNGLGLYHAKQCVGHWGGEITIDSQLGTGTTISVRLPASKTPNWFATGLEVPTPCTIVVLDDDSSIHQIWKERFAKLTVSHPECRGIKLLHFTTSQEIKSNPILSSGCLYLFDYELIGSEETGLDLIEKLGIASQSILVTSRFDEEALRERCMQLGLKILPKMAAGFVPIHLRKSVALSVPVLWDAILIDDDPIIHLAWNASEKKYGKQTRKFSDPESFLHAAQEIDLCTPICIDQNLGRGIKGTEIAKQAYQIGFRTIYLTTGFEPSTVDASPVITAILGKEPLWLQLHA